MTAEVKKTGNNEQRAGSSIVDCLVRELESKLRPPTPIRHSKELEATLKQMESKIAAIKPQVTAKHVL